MSVINLKGGVTKTSTVVGLGAALAEQGQRVLLVDCDPQSHVAVHLGEHSLVDVLEGRVDFADIILEVGERLVLAPSKRSLAEARTTLANRKNRDATLARALRGMNDFSDYVLIDTPPDEGILSLNAMYASEHILVPAPLDAFTLQGISPLIESIVSLREAYEHREWNTAGVLISKYDRRLATLNRDALRALEKAFGAEDLLFRTRIRADEAVRKAQSKGTTVQAFDPKSKATEDFTAFAREFHERLTAPAARAALSA